MSYSDAINSKGMMNISCREALAGASGDYLLECIEKLKATNTFSVFGGDRAILMARLLYKKFGLTPENFLVNRRYNPKVGKLIDISDGM